MTTPTREELERLAKLLDNAPYTTSNMTDGDFKAVAALLRSYPLPGELMECCAVARAREESSAAPDVSPTKGEVYEE